MARIVLCAVFLQTAVIFGCSLPLAVAIFGCSLPLGVAIFELLPLAVAIFLLICHFYLRQIAIFVEVVEFVPQWHRTPKKKKTHHQFSVVSGAEDANGARVACCF